MTGLGPDHTHPYLMSLIDKELVVYKAFPFEQTKNPGHLSVRFSKVSAGAISQIKFFRMIWLVVAFMNTV